MEKKNDALAIWPYNLIDQVLGDNFGDAPYNDIVSQDQIRGLEYVIETFLDERQRDMLRLHYRDGFTYRAIGEKYSLTASRVNYIIMYACRILRHPASKNIVLQGYYGSKILEEEDRLRALQLSLQQRRKLLEEEEKLVQEREEHQNTLKQQRNDF